MRYRKISAFAISMLSLATLFSSTGCSFEDEYAGKTVIKMLQYKPEAVAAFEKIEKSFNEKHDDIVLKIESPNEAMTVLKTRLIKEDYPDIVRKPKYEYRFFYFSGKRKCIRQYS